MTTEPTTSPELPETYEAVWRQFGGALTMLDRAIDACPKSLWERPSEAMGYWYLVYHTLFFVDHDLHPAEVAFESPSFDRFEYELSEVPPPYEVPYSRAELTPYLHQCSERVREVLGGLARGRVLDLRGGRRLEIPALEVVLYQLRHVQHHTAQLNAMLRGEGVEPPGWVRRGVESRLTE